MASRQQSLLVPLHAQAEKFTAATAALEEARTVSQLVLAETRRRLAQGEPMLRIGAILESDGSVHFVGLDPRLRSLDSAREPIRIAAKDSTVCAAAICHTLIRQQPFIYGPIVFCEIYTEHRSGTATIVGIPADENVEIAAANGAVVLRYAKKATPFIFV